MSEDPSTPAAPTLHPLAVKVKDLARAEAFYAGVLGLRVRERHTADDGAPRSIWLELGGGAFLAIERAEPREPARTDDQPGWHCVALGIAESEREGWRARLAARGSPVERESPFTLYVRDPEGALVALSHHPVPARTDAGATPPAGVTAQLAALVTLSVAVLALVPLGVDAQRRLTPEPPPDVVLLGSSSVNGAFGRLIESELERAGMHVRRVGHSSTGLARPDFFDWQGAIPDIGDLTSMRGVIVYMGGNDTQAVRLTSAESRDRGSASWIVWRQEARWVERYTARVTAFVAGLCDAGARRAIVILPADGERAGWAERIHRVQDAKAAGTRAARCGVVVDPRGVPVSDGSTVDGVHLSRTGSRAVWARIGTAVTSALAR